MTGLVLAGLSIVVPASRGLAANPNKNPHTSLASVVTGGNQFYRVHVEDDPSSNELGLYTATTGAQHPAGAALNVLYGDGSPGTTFNTIRSYTSSTDYVQDGGKSSSNTVVLLSPYGSVTPIGTTGFRATYVLPGPPTTPDALTIVQDVNVNGTTFANSTVEVTTAITNTGSASVALGIRYLWDFEIGDDDGPTFRATAPDGPVLVNEAGFTSPTFQSYRIQDNDNNPNPPTFDVFGTVTGPAFVLPPPTVPGVLDYVSWPNSFSTAFDYTVNPSLNVADSGGGTDDSAVLYFFGPTSGTALTLAAGSSTTVSASLFLTLPTERAQPTPALSGPAIVLLAIVLGSIGVLIVTRRVSA